MILDDDIKQQLAEYLKLMEEDIIIKLSAGADQVSKDMVSLVEELGSMSPKINIEEASLPRTPSFSINRISGDAGVTFAGIPLGHEFTSLVLALLQVSGRPPKIDDKVKAQVEALEGEFNFETYISLSCHNCPEVVQALNIMAVLNPNITHTMIDGGAFKDEVESKDIMAVPTVYLNGQPFLNGRTTLEEILIKLGSAVDTSEFENKDPFDVLVIGGGPAGASAAIYTARKGVRTGMVLERFGGQVRDTAGIENVIGINRIEGTRLSDNLENHVKDYDVDIMTLQRARSIKKKELIEVELDNGAVVKSKSVIISTGARWRNTGAPGEIEFKNKGVAYCPHCDGPLFKGKDIAVIGGGNSGIEAAIDLAGIVKHVTVLEFMPELKADTVLINRLSKLPNVTVLKNVETKEITGDSKVNGLTYIDRETKEEHHLDLEGVFVQIGLVPNTDWLGDSVERNRFGEILVNNKSATNVEGIFAAGDCTDSPYKQIVISMGSGATAGLGAYDYLLSLED